MPHESWYAYMVEDQAEILRETADQIVARARRDIFRAVDDQIGICVGDLRDLANDTYLGFLDLEHRLILSELRLSLR